MPKSHRLHPTTKILLASTITLALHSTLHAATDIETGTPGVNGTNGSTDAAPGTNGTNGGDATATITSSDSNNTVTATGGKGGTGGNGAPTTSAPQAGNAGAGGNGGNATASATLTPTGDVTLTITATAGNGGTPGTPGPAGPSSIAGNSAAYGHGGSATISPISVTNTSSANITVNASATSGFDGFTSQLLNVPVTGGTVTINPISASSASGNISLSAQQFTQVGSTLTNIFSASTTGNITLTQNAIGGGNVASSLTFINLNAASITATSNVTGDDFVTSSAAYTNLTGNNNVTAKAFATSASSIPTATAIATGNSNVIALATADCVGNPPNVGSGSATAYSSNAIFSNYDAYANGQLVAGEQQLQAYAAPSVNPTHNTFASATFPTFHIPNNTGQVDDLLVKTALQVTNPILDLTGNLQTQSVGFSGTINIGAITPEDLVLAAVALPTQSKFADQSLFNSLRFRLWIDNTTEIDQTFATLASLTQYFQDASSQFHNFDLGAISSFGPGPLTLQLQIDVTTNNASATPNAPFTFNIYNEDSALLTPEPASLSLLTAATLPLLLKRRRKN